MLLRKNCENQGATRILLTGLEPSVKIVCIPKWECGEPSLQLLEEPSQPTANKLGTCRERGGTI